MNLSKLSNEERLIYNLILRAKITQRQIADSAEWIGCHPVHEENIGIPDKSETTLRKVRQIIRDLRLNHHCPILSDVKGYWIPTTDDEVEKYLSRIERTAKSQAKAWMVTYHEMQKTFGKEKVKSTYFDNQKTLFELPEPA